MDLLKKLGIIVLVFSSFLAIRTLVALPQINTVRTADDLKAYLCETNWWDHWFSILEALFLAWGIRLCIVVRKAPSEFNESRFISMAIYNEFLLSIFLNVSMFFLHSPANPDLLYIICFCHTQITVTLLLCFIFGSKAYMVLKGHGKNTNGSSMTNIKLPKSKFLSKPSVRPSTSQTFPSTSSINISAAIDVKSTEQDIQDEIQNIRKQLETLKERNSRYGSKKLAGKLSAMYDCTVKNIDELSIDEDFSSAPSQERTDDNLKTIDTNRTFAVKLTANNTHAKRSFGVLSSSGEDVKSEQMNCCSTNAKTSNKVKYISRGSSCLKRFILRDSSLLVNGDDVKVHDKNEEIQMEPTQAQAIIFQVEEKSQCKQVSL